MNRDHDHDIADMLVRERNSKRQARLELEANKMLDKAVAAREEVDKRYPVVDHSSKAWLARNYMRNLFIHMLWVTENESLFEEGDFDIAMAFINKQWPEGGTDADIHRDGVPEDRHCELLRIGQGDLVEQDRLDDAEAFRFGAIGYKGR